MNRNRLFPVILAALLLFSGCGNRIVPTPTDQTVIPSRMVQRIEVSVHPSDADYDRCYTDMEKMSPILRILRDLDTTRKPEEQPNLTDGQTYYTITATYANDQVRVYYLLSHQYLRIDDGDWCEIDNHAALDLIQYIRQTPDEASAPVPDETAQESLPEEPEPSEETENTENTSASA